MNRLVLDPFTIGILVWIRVGVARTIRGETVKKRHTA